MNNIICFFAVINEKKVKKYSQSLAVRRNCADCGCWNENTVSMLNVNG